MEEEEDMSEEEEVDGDDIDVEIPSTEEVDGDNLDVELPSTEEEEVFVSTLDDFLSHQEAILGVVQEASSDALDSAPSEKPSPPIDPKKYFGFSQFSKNNLEAKSVKDTHFNPQDRANDLTFLSAIIIITSILTKPDDTSETVNEFDYFLHPCLISLLQCSTLPELLTELVRNDSISEWAARKDLYFAFLSLIKVFEGSESTLELLFRKIRGKAWSEGIEKWINGQGDIEWDYLPVTVSNTVDMEDDTVVKGKRKAVDENILPSDPVYRASLFELLKQVVLQATAFRKVASSAQSSFDEDDAILLG